jgi:hypothetical protein
LSSSRSGGTSPPAYTVHLGPGRLGTGPAQGDHHFGKDWRTGPPQGSGDLSRVSSDS